MLGTLPLLVVMVTEWYRRNVGSYDIGFVVWGGIFSFLSLLVVGIVLIRRRQFRWGLIALALALLGFFIYFMAMPAMYH